MNEENAKETQSANTPNSVGENAHGTNTSNSLDEGAQNENAPKQKLQEQINIGDVPVPIYRGNEETPYIAFTPPEAKAYIVAPRKMEPQKIVEFVGANLSTMQELQQSIIKRYKKNSSKKCRYETGDIVYLFGRPFVVRAQPISNTKRMKKATHGRANVSARLFQDVSAIDLFVLQLGNYDQRRAAFLAYAKPIFVNNAKSLVAQCQEKLKAALAKYNLNFVGASTITVRPMRSQMVSIDDAKDTIWVSETLLPFPLYCLIYEYAIQELETLAKQDERIKENFQNILKEVCAEADLAKKLLQDKNAIYYNQ